MKLSQSRLTNVSKIERTASDKAVYLMRDGTKLASMFEQSALLTENARAIAIADCLRETYRPQNIYYSKDQINYETGECFDGFGVLTSLVNTRLSKAYLTASARRSRKKIRKTLAGTNMLVGERYRFLTLTMPFLKTDCKTVLAIKDRALTLFKKRKLWTSNVRGAFISEEMTIGDSTTVFQTHYHAHAHALILGKWMDHWQIANQWTDCVEKACEKEGIECLLNTSNNRLAVYITDVEKYAKKKHFSFDDAINELCKYVVKGSDYEKVPTAELVEIEQALFKRQMIKSYGCFNNQKGTGEKEQLAKGNSLDTKCITDGDAQQRKLTLIETGVSLIEKGQRDLWLSLLRTNAEHRRQFRADQLAWSYPHTEFHTLDGHRWYGVAERAPVVVVALSDYKEKRRLVERSEKSKLLDQIIERSENKRLLNEIINQFESDTLLNSCVIQYERNNSTSDNRHVSPYKRI